MLKSLYNSERDKNVVCTVLYTDASVHYNEMSPTKVKLNESICEISYKNRTIYCARDQVLISLKTKEGVEKR